MTSLTRAYLTSEHLEKENQFPLHFAISAVEDADIEKAILKAHSTSPESIHQQDADGPIPIHLVAMIQDFPAVCALLKLGVKAELQDADSNKRQMTPLELFTFKCEYMLKQALGLPVSLHAYIEKRKYPSSAPHSSRHAMVICNL